MTLLGSTSPVKLTDFLPRLLNIIAVQQNLELRREAARLRTMAAEQSGKHEESAEHGYGPLSPKPPLSKHKIFLLESGKAIAI